MDTTSDTEPRRVAGTDDFTRTGALWVTATGAFLLVVAAAIFVAVRWEHLPEPVKLGVLGAMTGGALLAGRRLRRRLPATGAVVYHLGAFLLPIVAAALALRFEPSWPTLVLVEGVVGAVAFAVLARIEPSRVLSVSSAAAVVVAAVGAGGVWGAPPALTLAAAAVVAAALGHRLVARAWALLAGFAPALALTAPWLDVRLRLEDVALAGVTAQRLALVGGLVAGVVLFVDARRSRDLALLVAAGGSVALASAATWSEIAPPTRVAWLAGATLFLAIEVGAWLAGRDDFLARPTHALAVGAETTAAVLTAPFALAVLGLPGASPTQPAFESADTAGVLFASVVALVAWLLADARRVRPGRAGTAFLLLSGSGWWPAAWGVTATVAAGTAFGTGSATATAAALTATCVALAGSGRPFSHLLAAWSGCAAVLVTDQTLLAASGALIASLTIAWVTVQRARTIPQLGKVTPPRFPYLSTADRDTAVMLVWAAAAASVLPIALAAPPVGAAVEDTLPALLGWVLACWLLAVVLDRAPGTASTRGLGLVPRAAMLGALAPALDADAAEAAVVAAAIAAVTLVDGVRRRQPPDSLVAAVAGPVAVAAGATAVAGTEAGGVAVSTVALGMVAAMTSDLHRWHRSMLLAASWSAVLGLALSAGDAMAGATVLVVLGGAMLVGAVRSRSTPLAVAGTALATLGFWAHLDEADVQATDAYVAPVAVALLVAGGIARRRDGGSSWIAYGPGIGLMGAAALAERAAGAPGVHALVAGTIGAVAVICGGWRRLAAPLLLGTALLVAVVGLETVAYTASIPTWAWFALGGLALVIAGVAMERREVGPIQTGKRVADVLRDRFA